MSAASGGGDRSHGDLFDCKAVALGHPGTSSSICGLGVGGYL